GAAVGINGAVFDVATLLDGKVIIGGEFTEINGYSRNSYARLHYTGELDRNFDPGEGANGPVFSVALQPDGNILFGGQFTQVGEYEQNNITRVFGGEQFALGRVEFWAPQIKYDEGATTYELKVIRSGKVQEPVTVQYKTVDGTAMQGEDFTAATGDITFDKGEREATISISLLDDELAEGTESFTVELTSDAEGIDLGGRTSVEVVVIDNESSASLDQLAYEVRESDGEIVLAVSRYGGLGEGSTVNYTLNAITATADEDYSAAATGVLTFAPGAGSASLIIGIVDDLIEEPTEQLAVTLSGPSGGLTLVGELTTTVTILDNDQPVPGSTTFEAGVLPPDSGWSSSGSKPWYAQTGEVYEGSYAMRSGKITDAQESILVVERETGAGTGSFFVKISSEQDWDYLEFAVNGRALAKWSGRVNWKKFEFPLQAGINRLEWRYRKDPSTFAGMDAAFIDNVILPEVPVIEPEPETEPTLALVDIAAEGLRLSVTGDAASEYELQFSTDLKSWSTLANVVTDDTGNALYTDAASAETLAKETWAEAAGFYRAVLVVGDGGE
ncbi:MAG: hypothetical protein HOL38_02530, partial [Verrucomicrobia bacterium]|nr:hypothetical protein [Verrucomicrobiota bacterium]